MGGTGNAQGRVGSPDESSGWGVALMPTNKGQPTPPIRKLTYERDHFRCVSCTTMRGINFQHRKRTGMGGTASRPTMVDGLTSCSICNPRYESDMQTEALAFGWKVKPWVFHPGRVPVYYKGERAWFRLTLDGERVFIPPPVAREMMREVYGEQWDEWMEKVK